MRGPVRSISFTRSVLIFGIQGQTSSNKQPRAPSPASSHVVPISGHLQPPDFLARLQPVVPNQFFVVGMCAAFVYQHSVYVGHRSQSFGPILSEASSISSWHLNFSCRFQVRPDSNHLWPFLSDPGPEGASHSAKHFVYQISSYFWDPGSDEIKQTTQTPFTSLQPCGMDTGALPAPRLFGTIATRGAKPVFCFF